MGIPHLIGGRTVNGFRSETLPCDGRSGAAICSCVENRLWYGALLDRKCLCLTQGYNIFFTIDSIGHNHSPRETTVVTEMYYFVSSQWLVVVVVAEGVLLLLLLLVLQKKYHHLTDLD
jgi:hypothetical protein